MCIRDRNLLPYLYSFTLKGGSVNPIGLLSSVTFISRGAEFMILLFNLRNKPNVVDVELNSLLAILSIMDCIWFLTTSQREVKPTAYLGLKVVLNFVL